MDQPIEVNEEVLSYFRALVSVQRLKIAGLLALESLSQVQLAARLNLPPNAISRDLAYLTAAGIVAEEERRYRLNEAGVEQLAKRVLAGSRPSIPEEELQGDEYERKVLKDYLLADGKIKTLPAQEKKLAVILNYLATKFKPGMIYSEKQVNQVLLQYHPDPASLRRYLVDSGLMKREAGEYWLVA